MAKHQLSQATHDRLTAEFTDLTTRGRIQVADKIERAREMGDLKENGDYHAAKDEQGHMEGRIRQIESFLEDAEIFAPAPHGVVGLGTIVTIVYDGDSDADAERYLIGHVEEKPEAHDVSVMSPSSPLGSSLLGATVGAMVTYEAPKAKLKVKVLNIESAK
ncbi:MAG: transcription elongation factor GreA [Actinobacteria bacterium]|nr:MAG: transcription elongation factor GreA [Actinomycetota bacterium]